MAQTLRTPNIEAQRAAMKKLVIEGVGRTKTDGRPALQALGLISFDDDAGLQRRAMARKPSSNSP
jgi:hypothetical protein